MSQSQVTSHSAGADEDDAFDLRELLITLWKGKWVILGLTVLAAVIAVTVTLGMPNRYKATAILMPATNSSTSSLARLASQFGGLASLTGFQLGPQDEQAKTIAAMELIKSWGFQEQFIRDNDLEVPVFASSGWDRQTNQLLIDSGVYDVRQRKWVRNFDPARGQTAEPSGWELYKKLSKRITVSEDQKTGLITLSVEFYSPELAKDWVDKLIISVNRHLQERDGVEAEKSIRYLEQKMSQTTLVEIRSALSRLIEDQTKNLMLARVSDEYALRTLSPAKVPEERSGPKRGLICVVVTFAAGFLATAFWLLWSACRRWFS